MIVHGVLGIDTHQSALGILTIERSLRTAQHIYTVNHIEMVVERSLRHEGQVVVVDAHSGVVDA